MSGSWEIKWQRFDEDGDRVGTEFRVNYETSYAQARAAVADDLLDGDKLVIGYQSKYYSSGSNNDIVV